MWLGAIVVMVVVVLGYLLLILPTQWLKVEHVTHPVGIGKTVLQVSDLHVERLRVTPEQLQRVIRRENPDWIVLTGDFMDQSSSFRRLAPYLRMFAAAGKPCFAVLGNHDYHLPPAHVQFLIRMLRDHGVHVLRNQSVVEDGVWVVGIDDACTHRDDAQKAYRGVDGFGPVLVLTHDPNLVLTLDKPYHYLVAGHLHGKQFNLPLLYHFQPMGPLPFMGIYQGLHRTNYGSYYISKGVGQSGINARLFVRSEVTVHRL